jgi:hypothetical protein
MRIMINKLTSGFGSLEIEEFFSKPKVRRKSRIHPNIFNIPYPIYVIIAAHKGASSNDS